MKGSRCSADALSPDQISLYPGAGAEGQKLTLMCGDRGALCSAFSASPWEAPGSHQRACSSPVWV